MQARIYKPAKAATQSGENKQDWVLEFIPQDNKKPYIEHGLEMISSADMMSTEVKISFSNKEQAINFANENHYGYEVIEPQGKKLVKKSYAGNFG